MKRVSVTVMVLLLGSLLIIGCGGGGSNFTFPAEDSGVEDGTTDNEEYSGEVHSIDFISASLQTIAFKGTGGPPRSETSVLSFKVVDVFGYPVSNQTVNFELSMEVGGLSLSNESAESNPEGLVRVTVNAGNMPTHIRVLAFLADNPSIRVVSDELAVSTGLPDQNSIDLKIVDIIEYKWTYDNVYAIEFHAADHFNNFVPDGTVVYFTTEGGSINASAPTKNGSSIVEWRSGNPIPDDDIITILAFCIGEESFKDLNSNGLYDANEPLVKDLAEPFLDANENDVYDYGEWYWDSNNNGKFDGESNGIYNGTLCSDDAEALGLCSKELVYVYKSLSLMKAEVERETDAGDASSIDFISASPHTIALKGTGGPSRSETSVLYFKVVDEDGIPVSDQTVNFELSTEVGGLSLSSTHAVTNNQGVVRVTVNAGNMPTHIRVHAILADDPSIRIVSDELAVSTGLPDQDNIDLWGPDEWKYNSWYTITFHAADHFNNFVPEGTVVYFTTEGGSIYASAPTDKLGNSTVEWLSGNPIPDDGTITILAFCIGEESFKDLNSNGLYDANDSLVKDLAEPFLDANENGVHDYGEWYWDSNNNGKFDGESNGIYNGTLCSDDAEALGLCSKELVYVYKSLSVMKAEVQEESDEGNASSIDFISASPRTIALKGTGGPSRSETSALVFKVVDEYGIPASNQTVNFELSTEVGGLSLSSTSAVSNSQGQVRVTVNAGNMPTHIRVHAFLADDPSIRVVSDELAVTTGLPDADSISMSAEIYNSESWDYDNVQVPILFQAADIFNNFVPDGTKVSFTTEGGSIIGSSVIKEGVCEVNWRSGNPRPVDGLFTILAFCIGEESFTDLNSNGLYDANEPLKNDLAEPFRDDNQNGIHDDGEWYWDYNTNGEFDDEPNGIYNGTLCSDDAEASGECTKELVYVHAWVDMIMSGSFAVINFYPDTVDLTGGNTQTVLITISDVNNNPMPYKTVVKLTLTNGKFVDDSKSMEFKIGNTNLPGPMIYTATILPTKDTVTSGKLVVKVTTPFENETMDFTDVIDDYYEETNNN